MADVLPIRQGAIVHLEREPVRKEGTSGTGCPDVEHPVPLLVPSEAPFNALVGFRNPNGLAKLCLRVAGARVTYSYGVSVLSKSEVVAVAPPVRDWPRFAPFN